MTPDGHPLPGRDARGPGLWSVAASWIKEAPGIARAVAEWMTGGTPEIDIHEARHLPGSTATSAPARTSWPARREGFNKMYGIVHPPSSGNPAARCGSARLYERERELGAVFFETAGWERPKWYESNEPLLESYAGRLMDRGGRVGIALVVAHHQRRAPGHAGAGRAWWT